MPTRRAPQDSQNRQTTITSDDPANFSEHLYRDTLFSKKKCVAVLKRKKFHFLFDNTATQFFHRAKYSRHRVPSATPGISLIKWHFYWLTFEWHLLLNFNFINSINKLKWFFFQRDSQWTMQNLIPTNKNAKGRYTLSILPNAVVNIFHDNIRLCLKILIIYRHDSRMLFAAGLTQTWLLWQFIFRILG